MQRFVSRLGSTPVTRTGDDALVRRGPTIAVPPAGASTAAASITELSERAREVFRRVVESYVETGEPVGSRTLTRKLTETLSPATIRNIMADLQDAGLLPGVAKSGVSIDYAVTELGVSVREGADVSAVPDPIPFSLLLADHRAGDDSLFVYPWCE